MNRLTRNFYTNHTSNVAQKLLGKKLIRKYERNVLTGLIVETEAYFGQDDPPSHASSGKTRRSEIMWGEPGLIYVYFIYGMYHMLNVVTEVEGTPGAVLIRSLEPLSGLERMKTNRGTESVQGLTNGPGKLTQALSITRDENGEDLVRSKRMWIEEGTPIEDKQIQTSARIGISSGKKEKLRFFVDENEFVSK